MRDAASLSLSKISDEQRHHKSRSVVMIMVCISHMPTTYYVGNRVLACLCLCVDVQVD
jgi:hypothetical protein